MLIVVLALIGLGAALSPAASLGAKRCRSSQVKTKITILKTKGHRRHRATVCVPRGAKRPASYAAALRQSRAFALKRAPGRVRRLLRAKAARRVRGADAATDRALAAALGLTARTSRVTHESDTRTIAGPPGTRTVQHREGTGWDDEEPNPGVDLEVTTDTTSTRIAGLSSSKHTQQKLKQTISRCPGPGGVGRGVVEALHSEKQIVDRPGGGQATIEVRFKFDGDIVVQFSDEAKVASVEISGDWSWSTVTRLSERRGDDGQRLSRDAVAGGVTATTQPDGSRVDISTTTTSATREVLAGAGPALGLQSTLGPIEAAHDLVSGIARRADSGRCARIVPDPGTVHVRPGATVAITAGLLDWDGAPLPGAVKGKAEKATVSPAEAQADPNARFTYAALSQAPADRRDTVSLKHVSNRGRAFERLVTVIYDEPPPPPLPNAYSGPISGTWDTESTGEHWTYTGNVALAYTGDDPAPPPGGPPGRYRRFDLTSGSAQVSVTATSPFDGCGFEGSGNVTIDPGQSGYMSVQASQEPAYLIGLQSRGKSITVTKTGSAPECDAGETEQYPVPGIWVQTQSAHTSTSSTLADSEAVSTPQTPFDYETFSRWNLAPG